MNEAINSLIKRKWLGVAIYMLFIWVLAPYLESSILGLRPEETKLYSSKFFPVLRAANFSELGYLYFICLIAQIAISLACFMNSLVKWNNSSN